MENYACSCEGPCVDYFQVAIKFESTASKGCNNGGPPYEWQVYNKIAGCYGIPKIYAKGTQGGFHIMVKTAGPRSLKPLLHFSAGMWQTEGKDAQYWRQRQKISVLGSQWRACCVSCCHPCVLLTAEQSRLQGWRWMALCGPLCNEMQKGGRCLMPRVCECRSWSCWVQVCGMCGQRRGSRYPFPT